MPEEKNLKHWNMQPLGFVPEIRLPQFAADMLCDQLNGHLIRIPARPPITLKIAFMHGKRYLLTNALLRNLTNTPHCQSECHWFVLPMWEPWEGTAQVMEATICTGREKSWPHSTQLIMA